jgi:hypothetical protein
MAVTGYSVLMMILVQIIYNVGIMNIGSVDPNLQAAELLQDLEMHNLQLVLIWYTQAGFYTK